MVQIGGFIARESLLGDFDFSGGSVQIANRFEIDTDGRTVVDLRLTGRAAGYKVVINNRPDGGDIGAGRFQEIAEIAPHGVLLQPPHIDVVKYGQRLHEPRILRHERRRLDQYG